MPDILVKLYGLDETLPAVPGAIFRHPLPHEKTAVREWVARHFNTAWADEFEVSFRSAPASSYIAVRDEALVGFACYDVTARGFFGPTGVLESERGRGLGVALLKRSLLALRALGYAYAIIGDAGPVEFYVKTVGGIPIPDSEPGIYPPRLRDAEPYSFPNRYTVTLSASALAITYANAIARRVSKVSVGTLRARRRTNGTGHASVLRVTGLK